MAEIMNTSFCIMVSSIQTDMNLKRRQGGGREVGSGQHPSVCLTQLQPKPQLQPTAGNCH